MGVSSTRVGDHRGSARTVQYLSKNHMMVSGLRSARSGALPHLAVFAAESPVCLPSLSSLLSLPSLDHFSLYLVSTCDFGLAVVCLSRCGSIPPRPLLSLSYLGLSSASPLPASPFCVCVCVCVCLISKLGTQAPSCECVCVCLCTELGLRFSRCGSDIPYSTTRPVMKRKQAVRGGAGGVGGGSKEREGLATR